MKWIIKPITSLLDWCYNQGKLGKFAIESGLVLALIMSLIMYIVQLVGSMVYNYPDSLVWICLIPIAGFIIFHILRVVFILIIAIIILIWFGISILINKIKGV